MADPTPGSVLQLYRRTSLGLLQPAETVEVLDRNRVGAHWMLAQSWATDVFEVRGIAGHPNEMRLCHLIDELVGQDDGQHRGHGRGSDALLWRRVAGAHHPVPDAAATTAR